MPHPDAALHGAGGQAHGAAGELGSAVDPRAPPAPELGRALTRATLSLRSLGDELTVVFLITPHAPPLLSGFGFQPLESVRVSATARAVAGARGRADAVLGRRAGQADALVPPCARAEAHLGIGTW